MSNIEFIKQLFRCMFGKHDWQIMYQGIEGISKDCKCCMASVEIRHETGGIYSGE